MINFDLFPFQKDCLDAFTNHKKIIVNKSRQLGLSNLAASYSLWRALFHREHNVIIITTKMDVAKNFIKKVSVNLSGLPDWLVMPTVTCQSVRHIQFSNGSQIKALTSHEISQCNNHASTIIIDEAAFIDVNERQLQAMVLNGGQTILISTPSDGNNLFHKIWVDSKESKNDFYPIELPWHVSPERDQDWFNDQYTQIIAFGSEQQVGMELLCKFGDSKS